MTEQHKEVDQLLSHLFRHEYGKMVAVFTKVFGTAHLELVEDVVQDALLEATAQWPFKGVPDNPTGWLYRVARNKALNVLNREKHKRNYAQAYQAAMQQEELLQQPLEQLFSDQEIEDDQLRMIFLCCHPSLAEDAQVILILKTLCGFSIKEIASAYLSPEERISKRLGRARQKIRAFELSLELPTGAALKKRVDAVLKALYLLFNEGYCASSGNELIRYELCWEAIRLNKQIVAHEALGKKGEAQALLALMQLNASRFAARQDESGNLRTLAQQERSHWNQTLIQEGLHHLEKSLSEDALSCYHLLASISAYHCAAPSFEATEWGCILALYDHLLLLDNSPLILLNRAIALSKVQGPAQALLSLEQLQENSILQAYPYFYATLAQLLIEVNNFSKAEQQLEKAIQLSALPAEKKLWQERLSACREKIIKS